MVIDTALGIVLGAAALVIIGLIGPWLLDTVFEFIGEPVVYWTALVAATVFGLHWLGVDGEWIGIAIAVTLAVAIGGILLLGVGIVAWDIVNMLRERPGHPARAEKDMVAKRQALGYDS